MICKNIGSVATVVCAGVLASAALTGCADSGTEEYKPVTEAREVQVVDPETSKEEIASQATTAPVAAEPPLKEQSPAADSAEDAAIAESGSEPNGPEQQQTGGGPAPDRLIARAKIDDRPPVEAWKPAPPETREVKILIPENDFRVEGPENALRVTYDDINLLKVMNMEPVTPEAPELMPDWLKDLDGRRIRIRGFMSPTFEQTGLKAFLLGRDNQACCFPGRAKIYDLFPVRMREGKTVDFIDNRPFDVVGVFHIRPWVEGGELYRLYEIDDAIVIQK